MAMVFTDFTPRRYLVHWLASASLVMMTYNPFGHSYYHWITTPGGSVFFKILAGLGLFFVQVFTLWWITSSVGRIGLVAGVGILALSSYEILKRMGTSSLFTKQMIVELLLATLLAVGLSWPHMRTRLTGQLEKRYLIYHGKAEKKKKKYAALRAARRAEARARAAAARAATAQAAAARAAAVARAIARAPAMQRPIGAPTPRVGVAPVRPIL
ncbi:membrane hypothetical protein [Gammaproteobacteria bacterium]